MTLDDILADFDILDEWEDRYKYIIDLGKTLAPLAEHEYSAETRVNGCVSQVWLVAEINPTATPPILNLRGDSDAMIVKGLVAIALAAFSGKTPQAILETDLEPVLTKIGLREHLSSQRSNGLSALVARIHAYARACCDAA